MGYRKVKTGWRGIVEVLLWPFALVFLPVIIIYLIIDNFLTAKHNKKMKSLLSQETAPTEITNDQATNSEFISMSIKSIEESLTKLIIYVDIDENLSNSGVGTTMLNNYLFGINKAQTKSNITKLKTHAVTIKKIMDSKSNMKYEELYELYLLNAINKMVDDLE